MDFNKLPFKPADILIPKNGHEKWATVACDQFTSESDYWNDVEKIVGDSPSALRITLPEIYLDDNPGERISAIDRTMNKYLDGDIFDEYKNSMIYVERTLPNGKIRRGIVGAIDLEEYDFTHESDSMVRATEGTVLERIPPRVKIRRGASIELPHVMLLIDDSLKTVIEPCENEDKTTVYDFSLMKKGGHLRGYLLSDNAVSRISSSLCKLAGNDEKPFLFAVGDGNHSLATAKTCYSQNKTPLNRYALVEVVNIHDSALNFEPIYRVMFGVNPADVISYMKTKFKKGGTQRLEYVSSRECGEFFMPAQSSLPVGTLQNFIDEYISEHPDTKVDYIHGIDVTRTLASAPDSIGFIFEGMGKNELFPAVRSDGALPRKTFSMGEAQSKRYYMEARKINPVKS